MQTETEKTQGVKTMTGAPLLRSVQGWETRIQPRKTLLNLDHPLRDARKLVHNRGIVTRNNQPRASRQLFHPILRPEVRRRIQRSRDRHMLLQVLVKIHIVTS